VVKVEKFINRQNSVRFLGPDTIPVIGNFEQLESFGGDFGLSNSHPALIIFSPESF
jgi:hypothetical protein